MDTEVRQAGADFTDSLTCLGDTNMAYFVRCANFRRRSFQILVSFLLIGNSVLALGFVIACPTLSFGTIGFLAAQLINARRLTAMGRSVGRRVAERVYWRGADAAARAQSVTF